MVWFSLSNSCFKYKNIPSKFVKFVKLLEGKCPELKIICLQHLLMFLGQC